MVTQTVGVSPIGKNELPPFFLTPMLLPRTTTIHERVFLMPVPTGIVKIKNASTGFMLDSNTDYKVYTNPDNGGDFQKWKITPGNDPGAYNITDVSTQYRLDSNPDERVYTSTKNDGSFQQWYLEEDPKITGFYKIRDVATRLVLDSNADREVYTKTDNGGNYQMWTFQTT